MSRIVVGVDGSPASADALRWAVREAGARGWRVTALRAWSYFDQPSDRPFDPHYSAADVSASLERFVAETLGEGSEIEPKVVCDLPARALLDAASDAEMLVVGARGLGGFRGMVLGSVSQQCVHHSPVPVAVVRSRAGEASDGAADGPSDDAADDAADEAAGEHGGNARPAPAGAPPTRRDARSVVVGVDGSPNSLAALWWAADAARARHAPLDVVHAWRTPVLGELAGEAALVDDAALAGYAEEVLDEALGQVPLDGVDVHRHVARLGPAEAILEAAEGAGVVVVGSRGRGGFAGLLLGSVSQHVVTHAPCTVVVVPGAKH